MGASIYEELFSSIQLLFKEEFLASFQFLYRQEFFSTIQLLLKLELFSSSHHLFRKNFFHQCSYYLGKNYFHQSSMYFAVAARDIFCNQGITRAIIQVTSAGAIYAPKKFSAGQKFWQGNDQGKGFFTRAFALACPGVVPPLVFWKNYFHQSNF